MANTGFKGVDCRQTGTALLFRAFLQTSAGALLGTGTTTLSIIEIQSDGTVKTYDFNDNTFKTTACTTPTLAMTHRPSNNAVTTTGIWTAALTTLTGFTIGAVYIVIVNNTGASPTDQAREFQYGSAEGDLIVTAGVTGVAYLQDAVNSLGSGVIFRESYASGVIGASGGFSTAWGNSGQSFLASGGNVIVPISSISGTTVVVPITSVSGINTVVPIATVSGINVVVPTTSISGVFGIASINSGQSVLVYSGQLSGQPIAGLSGFIYPASGINTTSVFSGLLYLAPGSIFRATYASGLLGASGGHTLAWGNSGQTSPASGANVVVPVSSISGVNATVPVVSISGVNVTVPIASVSGITVVSPTDTMSGGIYLASGSLFLNTFASGIVDQAIPNAVWDLSSGIEQNLTPRQVMRLIAAGDGGTLSGVGTGTITINNAIANNVVRITGVTDSSGNRTSVTLNL